MGCGASAEEQGGNNQGVEDEELEEMGDNAIYENMEGKKKDKNDGDLFGAAENESNEQFMATKPWIGALKEPSNPPEIDMENPPSQELELEYVNGYRCEDSRQNCFYTATDGKIVFMSAALGVVHNVPENTQTFFGAGKVGEVAGHNDDIEALHVNPEQTICATGQRGKNPSIFIWDIESKEIIGSYRQGRNTRAVRQLKFTPDSQHIFTVDISNDHTLHIYKADGSGKVAAVKTGNDEVFDMAVCSQGSYSGAIATKRGIEFIEWDGGSLVKMKRGLGARAFMVSACFFPNSDRLAAGSTKGDIHLFNGNSCTKTVSLHAGGIHAIAITDNNIITSGFKDHILKIHDHNFQVEKEVQIPGDYARSLDTRGDNILMGTRDGKIIEINKNDDNQTWIMNGHGTGEAWGLALTGDGNVVTTGDDNKIVHFNTSNNKTENTGTVNEKQGKKHKIGGASTLSRFPPNQCSRSVAVHPTNGQVAVATNEGELTIRSNCSDLDNIAINLNKVARDWIEVMSYSPDGTCLAVGTHSREILFLDTENNYQRIGKATAHKAAILNIDWTLDSQYIRSVCNAYELLFFTKEGQQLQGGATQFKDEEYASQSCKLGWWVQGIFPPATDGSHVNGVARNNNKDLIATGDDWGFVNLYKNPNVKGSQCKSYRAHSSHVVRVQFNADDSYLYSIGGYDRCLMKWKVL